MYKYTEDENAVIVIDDSCDLPVGTPVPKPSSRWNTYVQPWLDAGNTPEPWMSAEEIKEATKLNIKQIAGRKINDKIPEWKQRNMLAESLELVNKVVQGEELTAEEQACLDDNNAEWAEVKAIRTYSDVLEGQVDADESPDITAGWPE